MKRRRFEDDMKDEMRAHLDERAGELIADGLTPRAARRQARLEFGGLDKYQEQCRERSGFGFWDGVRADLRYAGRNLLRHRLMSLTAIATLAAGMGVSSGLFALINIVALRGPVTDAGGEFVRVYSSRANFLQNPGDPMMNSWSDFQAFRGARALGMLAAWAASGVHADNQPTDALDTSLYVSCNFFEVYGLARPQQGRVLEPDDCLQQRPVAVISDALARRLFGSATAPGRSVNFRGHPLTVVGVVTTPFAGQIDQIGAGAWLPYSLHRYLTNTPEWSEQPDLPQLAVEGRLRPGMSITGAAAELRGIAAREDAMRPDLKRHELVRVTNGSIAGTPGVGPQARWGLTLAVILISLIALIAAANVTAVLLARAHARKQEIAVRLSLGGTKARLARMLLTESTMLALIAAVCAIGIALPLPRLAAAFLSDSVHPFTLHSMRPDWHVFAYLAALTLLAGTLAGFSPASESLKADISASLKGRQRGIALSGSNRRLRLGFTAAQVGLSLILLLLALCFTHARAGLLQGAKEGHGYAAAQLLWPEVQFRNANPAPTASFDSGLQHALEALPRTHGVAFAQALPSLPSSIELRTIDGIRTASFNQVSPEYFAVAETPLLSGRGFTAADASCRGQICAAVISRTMARRLDLRLGAILHQAAPPGERSAGPDLAVVGIAADTTGLLDGLPVAMVYEAWSPQRSVYHPLVRFEGAAASIAAAAQTLLHQRYPTARVTVTTVQSLELARAEVVSHGRLRQVQMLLLLLGVAAVALTAIGLYGTFAFLLAQRNKEMGIRIAFGASRRNIYGLAAAAGARPLIAGMMLGLALYAAVALLLRHLMAGPGGLAIYFWRPAVIGSAIGLMLLSGLAAVWGPARRACSTDPMAVLREE